MLRFFHSLGVCMLRNKSAFWCLLLLLSIFSLISCSQSPNIAGGTIETTNGDVVGYVYLANGDPAEDATVTMRTLSFLADTSGNQTPSLYTKFTNAKGQFIFDSVQEGSFLIYVKAESAISGNTINISDNDTSIIIDSIIADKPVTISGMVDSASMALNSHVYAFVNGTDIVAQVAPNGSYTLPNIPVSADLAVTLIGFDEDTSAIAELSVEIKKDDVAIADDAVLSSLFVNDTLVVRALLDSNDLFHIRVFDLIETKNSRVASLDLSDIGLSKVPDNIKMLSALVELNLSRNNLTTLPPTLSEIATLKKLWLGYNEFLTFPSVLWECTNVTWFEIGHNDIADSIPSNIANLTQLDTAYFSFNRIPYVSESIGQLTNLKAISIDNNMLTNLPDSLSSIVTLEKLMVAHNMLTDVPDSLHLCTSLMRLAFQNNKIDSLPSKLAQLDSLIEVNVSHNKLTDIPFTSDQIQKLSIFKIDFNNICNNADPDYLWLRDNNLLGFQQCQ